jgi:hypothetical protein
LARVARIVEEANGFGIMFNVLDWNDGAIEFYRKIGATFLDDWKTVCLILTRGHLAHHIWRSYRSLIRRFLAYWFARRQMTRIPEAEQKPNIGSRFFPISSRRPRLPGCLPLHPSVRRDGDARSAPPHFRPLFCFFMEPACGSRKPCRSATPTLISPTVRSKSVLARYTDTARFPSAATCSAY